MPLDSKIEFYLSHRDLIEEWASIRERAAAATDAALRDAFTQFDADYEGDDRLNFGENGNWRWAQIHLPEAEASRVGVHSELLWHQGHLFTRNHGSTWPIVGLMTSDNSSPRAKRPIFEATRYYADELQTRLANRPGTEGRWVWNFKLEFDADAHDVESYGRQCVSELVSAWSACSPTLRALPTPR